MYKSKYFVNSWSFSFRMEEYKKYLAWLTDFKPQWSLHKHFMTYLNKLIKFILNLIVF